MQELDDPLRDYIDRGFDLYGGLGHHPGMHSLFGLPKPAAPANLREGAKP